jgi:hypothetical protein
MDFFNEYKRKCSLQLQVDAIEKEKKMLQLHLKHQDDQYWELKEQDDTLKGILLFTTKKPMITSLK